MHGKGKTTFFSSAALNTWQTAAESPAHDSGLPFDEQAELQSLFVRVNAKRVGLKLPNDRFPFKMSHDIKLVNILKWCRAMGKQIGGLLLYGRFLSVAIFIVTAEMLGLTSLCGLCPCDTLSH